MNRLFHILLLSVIFSLITFPQLSGQFYYGHQMDFGKNRVQYNDFYWYFYRYEDFDTYFNQQGKNLANYTADYLQKEISRIESFFDYELENRLIFIVYNKLTDFRQSNIGLVTGKDEYNTGGVTKIIRNKVFIYFDGDHKKFEEQISAAITEVLINEMLYGNQLRENVTNSTLIELPDWYLKGLISYVSVKWSTEIEDEVKDGILKGRYDKFNRLTGDDAVFAGHSFWRFIAENYGESVIPNIIYLTRINKNSNSGFLYVLGFNIKELSYEWNAYYRDIFDESKVSREFPYGRNVLKKTRKKEVYNQIRISPGGKYIAYSTNYLGQYKIYLYDTETGKKEKIIQREHRLDQIPDLTYPVLNWHPTGKILSFFTEEEGGIKLYYYTLETGELTSRNILFFEKILDFSYSDDGLKMVMSAINRGQSDIYIHTLSSGTNLKVTSDIYDDFNPRFVNGSKQIIFNSNRPVDTIDYYIDGEALMSRNLVNDLYITDAKPPFTLTKVSNYEFVNDIKPLELGKNQFIFLSDQNGIINRHLARFDSTISFIDTTTHYRYFSKSYPITNYSRNIRSYDINTKTGQVNEILFNDGRFNIYDSPLETRSGAYYGVYANTPYIEEKTKALAEADSLKKIRKEVVAIRDVKDNQIITPEADTIHLDRGKIDINNYIFEIEKLNYYNQKFNEDNINLVLDTAGFKRPTPRIYETAFYTNYLATQIDFSFLGASYQAFTGGAVYYNPGFNLMFKLGTNDLFEDYKLTAGFRLSADFDSGEYLLSYENLKRRLNKQIVFHRQVFKSFTESQTSLVKSYTHNFMYILRWPFSQVGAFEGTVAGRQDRFVFLSTDLKNLNEENINYYWATVKLAYIFDNTRHLGINLYQGTRFKIFAEAYQQLNDKKYDLYTIGGDFRHYVKIHRTLIWANRFATGASFGRSRLIYYLGSVDNWTNFSTKVETFDRSIPIDYSKNYVFQTLATNMRGFTQNIRNGDRFAVFNSELRWPVIRYFANHPISSNFWNNLALVGFCDVGTAWNGPHPWSGENAYDNEVIENGPLIVTIDSNREPIVYGYGAGIRSMLLGYFIRLDWAWGVENKVVLPRIFYLSLLLDF